MTKEIVHSEYLDYFEYHGSTTIELVRKKNGVTIMHDWIIFDSVEEAEEYFHQE